MFPLQTRLWPRGWVVALPFHDHVTRRGWVVSCTPGRSLPPGKTGYTLYRRQAGPQGRSGRVENLTPPGFDPRTVQPIAHSLYRLSYPAHKYIKNTFFKISKISKIRHRLHTVRLTYTQIQSNSVYFFTLYPPMTGFNINFLKVYLLGGACFIHLVFS